MKTALLDTIQALSYREEERQNAIAKQLTGAETHWHYHRGRVSAFSDVYLMLDLATQVVNIPSDDNERIERITEKLATALEFLADDYGFEVVENVASRMGYRGPDLANETLAFTDIARKIVAST